VPRGRIIELFGKESSGKTTIALHMVASFQKAHPDLAVAFIDYEHAFDRKYAEALGVDTTNLVFAQPTYAEQGLQGVDSLIDTGKFSLIIVDSVAAMVPQSELEGDMDKSSIGVQARLMSKAMRKLTGKANTKKTTVVFINQLREKIGVMFGSPWVTTGGNALKFYASIRAEVKVGAKNKESDKDSEKEFSGNSASITVVKNKTAAPYESAEYDIDFGVGICREGEIIDYGVAMGIIKKGGSWFSYGDTKLGQGRASVKKLLADNPELSEELVAKIHEQLTF
jgi:recombination protein RecA